ncbi:MAG TPA: serine/threonine-protein kinase, partial [Thermoanaerobaculia bacterium]|nr:serine/threonine-protein kinase [Thermoanaerobaculia bacterium]
MNARVRFEQLDAVFAAALERPREERSAFVRTACAGDDELFRDVERLLAADESADNFLARPLTVPLELLEIEPGAEPPPSHLGPYRLLREIGSGGMGTVYLAERDDNAYERQVAVKVLRSGIGNAAALQRFLAERQILARLEHPGIARLYDGGTTPDGRPFLVMELVSGVPIDEYCDARQLPTADRLRLFRRVCDAVQHAHQNLLVHRDLKPANILVTPAGEPKLLDFGIAKQLAPEPELAAGVTRTGARVMTPRWASPEQVCGEQVTTASDVYSLGVLLYGLLAGRSPYRLGSDRPREIEAAICDQEPEPPSRAPFLRREGEPTAEEIALARATRAAALRRELHGDLDTIVLTALRKDPARRYASAAELAADLDNHLHHRPLLARPDSLVHRARKLMRRRRAAILAAAAVVALLLTLGLVRLGILGQGAGRCRDLDRDLRPVWGDAARARLAAVFGSSGLGYSDEVWRRVARRLDKYAAGIAGGRIDACQASVAGAQSAGMLDRRMACYAERRDDLAEVVKALSGGGAAAVREAPRTLDALDGLDGCEDAGALLDAPRELADADQVRIAEAKRQLGRALLRMRQYDAGEAALRESLQAGFASRDSRQVAATAVELAEASVKRTSAPLNEAEQWLSVARSAAATAPAPPETLARLAAASGEVALRNGDLELAAKEYERAGELAKTPVARLDAKMGLRRVFEQMPERKQQGLALARETLALGEEAFGPRHPDTVLLRVGLAIELRRSAQPGEAELAAKKAREDARRISLPEGEGAAENLLGNLAQDRGELDGANAHFERALAAYDRAYGRRSSLTAEVLNNLAELALRRERLEEAEALRREVLAINQVVLGPKHVFVAEDLSALGHVLLLRGRAREAGTTLKEALRLTAEHYGSDSPEAGLARLDLALTLPTARERSRAAAAAWRTVLAATDETSADRAMAMTLYGEALATAGRRADGLRWMRRGTALLERVAGPD